MHTNTKQELIIEMNETVNKKMDDLPELPKISNYMKRPWAEDEPPIVPKKPKYLIEGRVRSDNGKRFWSLIKPLGKGGCGEVFLAKEDGLESIVALKVVKDKKQYASELKVMKILNNHPFGRGNTPKLICACRKSKALIMEYLSDPLSLQFEKAGYKFSLKTCLMLAINMLKSSRSFYERTGLVHVDIKPSNFCVGPDGRNLYLIDFGYSTNPDVKLPGQTGTPLFMAWTIQTIGNTYPCWLDDLESIGYVIMVRDHHLTNSFLLLEARKVFLGEA
jgi:serine/threonine protein kinase